MGWLSRKRTYILAFWLGTGLVLTTYHNACSKAEFAASASSVLQHLQSTALVLINRDAIYTNNAIVEVNLESRLADEVYVTNDPTCASGGVWEPKMSARNWTLGQKNQEAKVYASFRNISEGVQTACIGDAIIHDDEPPSIVLEKPSIVTNINAPVFNFLAGDALSGLEKSTCQWPGQASPVACDMASSNGNVAEGRHLVNVVAYDRAGNQSAPSVQDLIVDRTKPTVTFLSVPAKIGNIPNISIAFSAQDNLAGIKDVECAWENVATFAACASPVASARAEGSHKFYVRARDKAGNVSDPVLYDFAIDLSAPTVTITSSPADFSPSASATFTFTGVDGAMTITDFECRLDSGSWASCNSPQSYSGLADGIHKFQVRGRDNVGNMSAPAERNWYVDTIKPAISFIQTPATVTKNTTADYKYNVADTGTGIATVECAIDADAYATCAADAKSFAGLAKGNHTFKIRATDKAGNSTQATHTFTIDLDPPTLAFTNVPSAYSNLTTFDFGFQAQDNQGVARVECRLDAQAFAACDSVTTHRQSGITEGPRRFGIRAIDTAGNISNEVAHNWSVDLSAPTIAFFQNPPATAAVGVAITIGFNVDDTGSGVKTTSCTLNGAATPCASGQLITQNALPSGDYVFVVTAVDSVGNSATETRNFRINNPAMKTQYAEVKQNGKVDILVVMDNSGSMETEQSNMAARFPNFISKLNTLDWQVAVITTDVASDSALRDGRLIELEGMPGKYILNSTMDKAQAQTVFGNTIQMPTNGSGTELGFKASIRAIERAFAPTVAVNAPNVEFFRADAALAILVVSDAYDNKTQPAALTDMIKAKWGNSKAFTFHSIVVPESSYTNPNATSVSSSDPCKGYRESVKFDGRSYHMLSANTGGVSGTVCTNDYSAQLSAMGTGTAELVNSVMLDCQPVDVNNDGKLDAADIQVTSVAGANITDFVANGTKLTFNNYLPVGVNELKYYCVQ